MGTHRNHGVRIRPLCSGGLSTSPLNALLLWPLQQLPSMATQTAAEGTLPRAAGPWAAGEGKSCYLDPCCDGNVKYHLFSTVPK